MRALATSAGLNAGAVTGVPASVPPRPISITSMLSAAEALGEARGAAHHVLRPVRGADAAQQVLARLPHRLVRAILLHLVLDDVGGAPERDLAQREQAPLAEECRRHALLGFSDVHLAF